MNEWRGRGRGRSSFSGVMTRACSRYTRPARTADVASIVIHRARGCAREFDGPWCGLNTTTTAPPWVYIFAFLGGRWEYSFFFLFCVARGRRDISAVRVPWTCPDRRVLNRREGGWKGYVCTRGTCMEGGTRMDKEGVHARANARPTSIGWEMGGRARRGFFLYASGGGFLAGGHRWLD